MNLWDELSERDHARISESLTKQFVEACGQPWRVDNTGHQVVDGEALP